MATSYLAPARDWTGLQQQGHARSREEVSELACLAQLATLLSTLTLSND